MNNNTARLERINLRWRKTLPLFNIDVDNKPVWCPSQGRFGVRDTDMLYIDHLFIQDIIELPGPPRTHLHLCCSTCCFSGPVARTASPPSWLNICEQSNKDYCKGKPMNGLCCEATVTYWCCEVQTPQNREGVQKVSDHMWETQRKEKKKKDGMRLERQVTVSLVFRSDPVGVMRMTLVGGDI